MQIIMRKLARPRNPAAGSCAVISTIPTLVENRILSKILAEISRDDETFLLVNFKALEIDQDMKDSLKNCSGEEALEIVHRCHPTQHVTEEKRWMLNQWAMVSNSVISEIPCRH